MSQESHSTSELHLFLRDKQAWENAIATYKDNDPLELWFNYICWYDYNIHIDPENKFQEILEKCLSIFERNETYKQDVRMVKLWVKYIDLQSNPLNLYQILYQRGVGTQCACFYIGWAHYYDSANAFKQAESVYNLGFQAKAEPYRELQEAHTKFRLSISQRMLYNDISSKKLSANNLIEQRHQITALTLNASTNSSIKKHKTEPSGNCADINSYSFYQNHFQANNEQRHNMVCTTATEQVHTNNGGDIKSLRSTSKLIFQKSNDYILENVKISPQFARFAKNNFETWKPLLFIEDSFEFAKRCVYQKDLVYPGEDMEYSPEEIRSRKWFKKVNNHALLNKSMYYEEGQKDNLEYFKDDNTKLKARNSTQSPREIDVNNSLSHYSNDNYSENKDNFQSNDFNFSENFTKFNKTQNTNQDQSNNEVSCFERTFQQDEAINKLYQNESYYQYDKSSSTPTSYNNIQNFDDYVLERLSSEQNSVNSRANKSQFQISYENNNSVNVNSVQSDIAHIPNHTENSKVNDLSEFRQNEEIKMDKNNTNKFSSQYWDRSSYSNAPQDFNKNHHITKISENVENQIEESKIHFKSDANGAIKNKTITIKFRREVPDHSKTSHFNKVCELDKVDTKRNVERKQKKHKHSHNISGNSFSSNQTFNDICSTRSAKERKIEIVNKYCDQKIESEIDPDAQLIEIGNSSLSSELKYENSSFTLSPHRISDDSNTFNNDNGHVSQAMYISNCDSLPNNFNSSSQESSIISNYTSQGDLSQLYPKTSSVAIPSLQKSTSSISLQNDDSTCFYEQSSFYTLQNTELAKEKLVKATATIEKHLAKTLLDPFNNELCKAFLTKLNFPSIETSDTFTMLNTPIQKLANTKTVVLAGITYNIEKEVGKGSYGSVYKAVNTKTGDLVALKYQKPSNIWEMYICNEIRKRIKDSSIKSGFMNMFSAIIAPNASIIITEFSVYGTLLDISNKVRQSTKKVMHEYLAMYFSCQILSIVSHLHSCKIIHADIKPDNFLLMKIPNTDSFIPSLRLIDFGCAIDMTLFPNKTQFRKVIQTDGFTCVEMREGKPWSYQTDLFCMAGTIHVILLGEYMQLIKKFDQWDIKQKIPRYLKKHIWSTFFKEMLNIEDVENLPNLMEFKFQLDDELRKVDSELQSHIRTLSNILHRR